MANGYDVIVVGTRAAGAATAMLLARAGLTVLAVDRARFPSDTLSTHQIQLPGVALLDRWGLLDRLIQAGTPPTPTLRLDVGAATLTAPFPSHDGVSTLFSPRRTVLDALLVDAAREAGAEVREGFSVDNLRWDGGRVVGITGRTIRRGDRSSPGGRARVRPLSERARLVIGADGKRSFVARAVGAETYRTHPRLSFFCYAYWAGLPLAAGELYHRPGSHAAGAFATNDGATIAFVIVPLSELDAFRADISGRYHQALDACGSLGERIRAATRVERFRIAPDLPNWFRVPYGPGWALVGDAGLVMDPITAQGISNAFRDADQLATAVVAGLSGLEPLDRTLARHHRERDARVRPMYDFTIRQAGFEPMPPSIRYVFQAIAEDPRETQRFFSAFAGVTSMDEYLAPPHLMSILGPGGIAKSMGSFLRLPAIASCR